MLQHVDLTLERLDLLLRSGLGARDRVTATDDDRHDRALRAQTLQRVRVHRVVDRDRLRNPRLAGLTAQVRAALLVSRRARLTQCNNIVAPEAVKNRVFAHQLHIGALPVTSRRSRRTCARRDWVATQGEIRSLQRRAIEQLKFPSQALRHGS